jgi:hypothetical protein
MYKRKFLLLLLLAMSISVTACNDDEATTNPPTQETARVQVVHASPNAPAVDILVDGTVVQSSLVFPNNTPYLSTTAGTRNIKVRVSGTTTIAIDANVPFSANSSNSIFAVDSVSKISALVVTDDLTAPATGKAHIRFIHLSPNAPAVDVALQGGSVVFSNKTFKTFTPFTPLDAGTYDLEVRLAGTNTVVLSLNAVVLKAGEIYTVFARGFVGGSSGQELNAKIIVNKEVTGATTSGNGRVMIVHASPNAPGVEALLANTVLNPGSPLTFPNNTGYLSVAAGMRGFKVRPAATTTDVINANVSVAANQNYSVFATDSVSKIAPLVLTDDLTPPASGKAHVRFVHLSPNAPAVDVAVTGGGVVFANRRFKEFTPFTPLDAGTYNLEVRLAGGTTVVLPLPGIVLQAGKIYTVFARGFVGATGAQALGAQIIVNN